MMLSLVACGDGHTTGTSYVTDVTDTTNMTDTTVNLSPDNILDYVQFEGEFTGGKYTKGIVNWAEAILEFQTYPVAAGKFDNVEITLLATSDDFAFTYMNKFGNYWHLSDAGNNANKIEFTFKLSVDGEFSKNYSVECLNNTAELSGSCNFEIISVSGTFSNN